ncbi:MAG: SIMPL domain-containing protein [Chloroflexi bacterium]|nr:SIMPL domain-containing protein [Chloroflexota bacterium]
MLSDTTAITATEPYTIGNGPQRTVSVSGVGQVKVQPDQAIVQLGVQNDAPTAGDAMSTNSKQMQALINALKTAGIPAKNIQTEVINLQPRYPDQQATKAITPTITGYTAMNTVSVQVDNISVLGDLLDAAVKAGANRIQDIRLVVSNPAAQMDQARTEAMRDAQHKAQQLATLGNARLGPVLTINESSRAPAPVTRAPVFAANESTTVPIEAGTQIIEVDVQVTWLLR